MSAETEVKLEQPRMPVKAVPTDGQHRPRVLTFVDYYLPGFKAGGPLRALSRLTEALRGKVEFRIVTADRDLGSDSPYSDITPDEWRSVGSAEVRYASPGKRSLRDLRRLLAHERYDVLYLNSLFSRTSVRVLLLRGFRLVPPVPLILAPRGEFDRRALSIRWGRKRLYIAALKLLRATDGVIWQASSAHEVQDIHRMWSSRTHRPRVELTPELVVEGEATTAQKPEKHAGQLSCVFLARVCRVKNLHGVLSALKHVTGNITLDIFGPLEDPDYWRECEGLIPALPASVRVTYHGTADPTSVGEILALRHLYVLPTYGENFGHGIIEALGAGCPALVGVRTPWSDLDAAHAGKVVDPTDSSAIASAIQAFAAMDEAEYSTWVDGARRYAARLAADESVIDANRALFMNASSRGAV